MQKPSEGIRVDSIRLQNSIKKLAEIGETKEGGVNRVAFSPEEIKARDHIKSLMQRSGLEVRIDAAGNICGKREGLDSGLAPIMFGSHIDTVPHGGRFDGALGVLAAIECINTLNDIGITTRHPLEVIVFTDEEGGLIGSRALTGDLSPEALEIVTHSGKTVREGLRAVGGNPDGLEKIVRSRGDIKAFVELHIEQGQILEKSRINIGIVEGIVGISWWEVTIEGKANHAGTTPMDMRSDALLAAAHFIIAVNQIVRAESGSQVGTVGRIKTEPGAPNVIPGRVRLSLELRDLSAEKITALFLRIKAKAADVAKVTDTLISFAAVDAMADPSPTDAAVRDSITAAAKELGLTYKVMPSGAGHDAQEIANIAPIGMIFVPSVNGISHSPEEYTTPGDIVNGTNVLLHTILKLDHNK